MTVGLVLTALTFGLRHGVDWDHIAAIADLSASAETRRRGFVLSFVYASAHAVIVLVLGAIVIAVGATLPTGAEVWMGRIVGLTLIGLGTWIIVELARRGREFRLRSRWILILHGTFAGLRRVRGASAARRVAIDHEHAHLHVDGSAEAHDHNHNHNHSHDHPAVPAVDGSGVEPSPPSLGEATLDANGDAGGWVRVAWDRGPGQLLRDRQVRHRHRHQHELALADDPTAQPGNGTAAGIGLLHGIGVESPTQIAVFAASTSVVGWTSGMIILLAWVVGLLLANCGLAILAGFGLLQAERNFTIYATLAVVVAAISVGMGALLLANS